MAAYRLVQEQLELVAARSNQHYDLHVRPVTYVQRVTLGVGVPPASVVGTIPKMVTLVHRTISVEKVFKNVLYRVRRRPEARQMAVNVYKIKPCLESSTSTRKDAATSAECADEFCQWLESR